MYIIQVFLWRNSKANQVSLVDMNLYKKYISSHMGTLFSSPVHY